jgi:hypothetical protein
VASFLVSELDVRNTNRSQTARTLLQWVFRRHNQIVTCQLDQEGDRYQVSLVPQGSRIRRALIATFDAGLSAFQGHATLAAELRRQGWAVVAYR